jgi:hypothetical protein
MHRSGTSMVAKLLQEAGLYLGTIDDLMPPAEQNPEGFYEHLGFVRLNDELLNAAGAGWDCPPAPDFDWTAIDLEPFRERARFLADPLRMVGPWGWKDPRSSLTMPFWYSVFGRLRTIAVIRNPLEVVTSLHRRDGFSPALGLTLWRIYAERLLAVTTPAERLVTHFDAYFVDPEREINRLLAVLELETTPPADELRAAALPSLRHHRKTLRDLDAHGFPRVVVDLYRQLCREAGWWEGGLDEPAEHSLPTTNAATGRASITLGSGRVDLLRVENEVLRRNNADFTTALAKREVRISELEMALQGHEVSRVELDGKVAERDSKIRERNALIVLRDQTIADLNGQLARLQQDVQRLGNELAESERARSIAELHERELRSMMTAMQSVQLHRDAEIMATLGSVLSRHAPGAPASIYYRRLVAQVRRFVDQHVPATARMLVATYGDDAMLQQGERRAEPFPYATPGVSADYTDVTAAEAVAQLEALRESGAEYLVMPSPALPWLANHPQLERHLTQQYDIVASERGVATIYDLGQSREQRSA